MGKFLPKGANKYFTLHTIPLTSVHRKKAVSGLQKYHLKWCTLKSWA